MISVYVILAFSVGMLIGSAMTNYRWISNADVSQRIYHNKKLYKVTTDKRDD